MARPCKLNPDQIAQLRAAALETMPRPPWWRSTEALVAYCQEEFGVEYTTRAVALLLERAGLHPWRNPSHWCENPCPTDRTERAMAARMGTRS